ncbi:MAG: hypothetical protein PHY16_09760 [Methylobacter sp.]|nr:hypothetical protein [Methylobacter sp.]
MSDLEVFRLIIRIVSINKKLPFPGSLAIVLQGIDPFINADITLILK